MVANTPAWGLPYPDDYQQPADSPNALEDLASATDAALTGLQGQGRGEFMHGRHGTQTSDWNAATESGAYWSVPGAANMPAASLGHDYWLGLTIRQPDPLWAHQLAWPMAASATPYPTGTIYQRALRAGTWEPWGRAANYQYSWTSLDNLTSLLHGPHPGVARFAHGMKKAEGTNDPSPNDEWRVQCYDTAGNFTWSAIKILENGVVSMPKGHALALERLDAGEHLDGDQVVTVGMLVELLHRAGIEVRP